MVLKTISPGCGVWASLMLFYILEFRANFTVRIHNFLFFYIFYNYYEKERKVEELGRAEREMEAERDVQSEKEGEVEERNEERGVEGERITEEACQEEERCEEEDLDSTAKRARVSAVITYSQETVIVEFVKDHSELYARHHEESRGSTTDSLECSVRGSQTTL